MSRQNDDRTLPNDDKSNRRLSKKYRFPEKRTRSSSYRPQNKGLRKDCRCQETFENARRLFKTGEVPEAFTELGRVMISSHGTKKHHKTEQDCIEMIVDLLMSPHSDLLYNHILKIPEQPLRQVLEKLASKDKWREIAAIASRKMNTQSLPKSFAKNMSVIGLLSSKELGEAEDERLAILTLLLDNGMRLPEVSKDLVRHALQNREYRVAGKLIKSGSDPRGLSMSKEHTPYYTAFDIALNKDKGNFTLCQQLLDMHEQDPEKYSFLNPKKDKTVCPLVMMSQSSMQLQDAMKLLQVHNFPREISNTKKNLLSVREAEENLNKCKALLDEILKEESSLMEINTRYGEAKNSSTSQGDSERQSKHVHDITHRHRRNGQGVDSVREASESSPVCRELMSRPDYGERESLIAENQRPLVTPVWEVECTEKTWKKIQTKKIPADYKDDIARIIYRLASGQESKALKKQLKYKKKFVSLYEAKLRKGPRILWTQAINLSSRVDSSNNIHQSDTTYIDKIRIWDIVMPHKKIFKKVERFVKCCQHGKESFLTRKVKEIPIPQCDGIQRTNIPRQFQLVKEDNTGANHDEELYPLVDVKHGKRHIKCYDFWDIFNSRAFDNAVLTDIDFPFLTNKVEQAVINLPPDTPILVVGRSGTGKTICCLYRLWSRFLGSWGKTIENEDHSLKDKEVQNGGLGCQSLTSEKKSNATLTDDTNNNSEEDVRELPATRDVNERFQGKSKPKSCHLHQLYVTKGQRLCSEVRRNFREMYAAKIDLNSEQFRIWKSQLPSRLQDVHDFQYPLFLTSWELLYILDRSLGKPYFFEDCRLPASFTDENDKVTRVQLECDGTEDEGDLQTKKAKRREMTYEEFVKDVWPKLQKSLKTSVCSPALVWTEIMSFIKGSNESLKESSGHLDISGYERVGKKMAPNFSENRRAVYEVFEKYEEVMNKKRYFDLGDAVFSIYKKLSKSRGSLPWTLHQIYVDEIQDFTQAEVRLLIALAQNPNDMFFCGDTAQGILRGVSFRFTDVKTLFYEEKKFRKKHQQVLIKVPHCFHQLTHSYRSHAGILRLASAVLDLLMQLFPMSFDHLKKDEGVFDGPKPVLIECEQLEAKQLSFAMKRSQRDTFGADQVVLVVNDEAKPELPPELSEALVLTISEAKGLEFDDVLLYNFFSDSQASNEWHIVSKFTSELPECTNGTRTNGLVQLHEDCQHPQNDERNLDFDSNKYKILESELKCLYTAITRARDRVIIYDENKRKRGPMYEFFKQRELVTLFSPNEHETKQKDEDPGDDCRESYEKRQWEKRGDEMMDRKLFENAVKCYKNAGTTQKENVAKASLADAKASLPMPSNEQRAVFLETARLFLESYLHFTQATEQLTTRRHLGERAAHYLDTAKEYDMAADMYTKMGLNDDVIRLYKRTKNWRRLSQIYEAKRDFNNSIKILDVNKMFDEAIEAHKKYKEWKKNVEIELLSPDILEKEITREYVESLYTRAAKSFHRCNQKEKVFSTLESLPVEKQIATLISCKYILEAADLMKRNGEVIEAVKVLSNHGYVEEAETFIGELDSTCPFKAQYYYSRAKEIVRETDKTEEKKNVCTNLEECLHHCSGVDLNLRGECYLALHELQPDREDYLENAYHIFSKMEPETNTAGVLECYDLMNRRHGITDLASCDHLIDGIQLTFKVVWALLHSDTDHEVQKATDKTQQETEKTKKTIDTTQKTEKMQNTVDRTFKKTNIALRIHPNTQTTPHHTQATAEEDKRTNDKTQSTTDKTQIFTSKAQTTAIKHFYDIDKVLDKQIKHRFMNMMEGREQCETIVPRKTRIGPKKLVKKFTRFLLSRAKGWTDDVEFYINKELSHRVQCSSFQEGTNCEDAEICPFLHEPYSRALTQEILQLFLRQIQLHSILQTGAESLPLQDLAWARKNKNYTSVQLLLEFLLPSGLLTYNMDAALKICLAAQRSTCSLFQPIREKVQLFVSNHLYGMDNSSSEPKFLEKCCQTTHWIVLGSFVSALFNLDIKVEDICKTLEDKLPTLRPGWTTNAHKYALSRNPDLSVTLIARKHLEAVQNLRSKHFDPVGALIRFVEFAELLLDRDNLSMMPEWPIFQLWFEVFSTLSLYVSAGCSRRRSIYLPECYKQNLRLVSTTLMQASKITLQDLLQDFVPSHPGKIKIPRLIQRLVSVICGRTCNSSSLLRFLFRLDQSDRSTRLIIERVVVLMVVMLVNTEHGCVPVTSKDFILRALNSIDLCKMTSVRNRVASLIKLSREVDNHSLIRNALDVTLLDMHGKMMTHQDNDVELFDDPLFTLNVCAYEESIPVNDLHVAGDDAPKLFGKKTNSRKLNWDNPRRLQEVDLPMKRNAPKILKAYFVNSGFPYHKIVGDPKWSKKQEQLKKKRK